MIGNWLLIGWQKPKNLITKGFNWLVIGRYSVDVFH